jgi:hypothetical protein
MSTHLSVLCIGVVERIEVSEHDYRPGTCRQHEVEFVVRDDAEGARGQFKLLNLPAGSFEVGKDYVLSIRGASAATLLDPIDLPRMQEDEWAPTPGPGWIP